ncbi:MAG: sigma-70 family RNA polymerase sigma factor [Deltaproteobacteria bacterium]|nr:sigma-70 family RNA polymerase sigma factor [Deltaproteobacteria bacterium]
MLFSRLKKKPDRFEKEALSHLNSVYRVALSMTGSEMEAQDLAQETMLKAFRFFSSYKEGTNCKAWLVRILINSVINHKRKLKRDFILLDDLRDPDSYLNGGEISRNVPEENAARSATREQIREALMKIPEEYRTAVILSDIEELSYKEISEALSCPIGTVMSRLFRGRRMLKERLIKMNQRDAGHSPVVAFRKNGKENDL